MHAVTTVVSAFASAFAPPNCFGVGAAAGRPVAALAAHFVGAAGYERDKGPETGDALRTRFSFV